MSKLKLSVVVPVFNEEENIELLIREIGAALDNTIPYEMIFVDDCSNDDSLKILVEQNRLVETLQVLTHKHRTGQSAAIRTGVKAAKAHLVATLDGDRQNDPCDILNLLKAYEENINTTEKILICGYRANRKDGFAKRFSSKIANYIRSNLLRDSTPDSGCGLKLFQGVDFMEFPSFDHMHRFLPALMIRSGGKVISVRVTHRSRDRGESKYGILDRLWVGIFDLFGVAWLRSRPIKPEVKEPE